MIDSEAVTVITVNYNHESDLAGLLESLSRSTYPISEVILIDNASTDDSVSLVTAEFPEVRVISLDSNLGFGAGLNTGIKAAASRLVCHVGPDVEVEPNWLAPLVEAIVQHEKAILAKSLVLKFGGEIIDSEYNSLHYTGHFVMNNAFRRVEEAGPPVTREVGAVSSTSMLLDKHKFQDIGMCDEDFFVYHEDFDLSYRARMMGFRCFYVPTSVVYHGSGTLGLSYKSGGQYPAAKAFLLSRNRWHSLLKNYSARTILAIVPALLLVELATILFMVVSGVLPAYFRSVAWILRNRGKIRSKRARVQARRRVSDRVILSAEPLTLLPATFGSPAIKALKRGMDWILAKYWTLVHQLI